MVTFSDKARLITMMLVTSVFFLAEILTGYVTNSMALVADSFHMLSDILSIFIGYLAIHYSDKKSKRNTYDWARAEVLGAMANAVFLLALVFTIFISAIQRLIEVEEITKPLVILGVGGAGLAINIFGLILFGGHAHGYSHGHGHSHGHDHSHEYKHRDDSRGNSQDTESFENTSESGVDGSESKSTGGSQMNMHAVFLHVLGDALGSVVVVISALVIYFVEGHWRFYIDPIMSLLISIIICWTTIPVLRNASMILLQNPPRHIDVDKMKEEMSEISGVIGIHDLHIWQLTGDCVVGTVHLKLRDDYDFIEIAQKFKLIFHKFDIHSTTIQPEFQNDLQKCDIYVKTGTSCRRQSDTDRDICHNCIRSSKAEEENDRTCLLRCLSDDCSPRMCCDDLKTRRDGEPSRSYDNPGYRRPTITSNNNTDFTVVEVDGDSGTSTVV